MNQRRSRKTKREQQPGYKPPPPHPPRPKELPPPNVFFVALVAIVGILGLLCLFAVGLALHKIWAIAEKQELVRTLPDVTRAAPGETAILDGRIAASVPVRHREFVAYIRERYGGKAGEWRFEDQAKPPLAVETGARVYTIGRGYAFDRLLWNWTDASRIDEEATTWRGAIRIQGIVAQGPVMAVGRLVQADGGALDFHADSVVALSRAEYFDRLVADRAFQWKFAFVAALLAALGIYLGLRGVYRIMGWPWARPEA